MKLYSQHFFLTLYRLAVALLIFTVSRILFWVFNYSYFPEVSLLDFLTGIRFDISTVIWLYLPFILFSLIPLNIRSLKAWQVLLKILFHVSNTTAVVLNLIDIEYFKFTLKRSGIELFKLIAGGDDLLALIPAFIKDYYYLIISAVFLIALSEYLYRNITRRLTPDLEPFNNKYYLREFGWLLIGAALAVLGARGGFQLTPLSPVDAGLFTHPSNTPLVLNTPFTVMKSFNREIPEQHSFMPPREAEDLINRKKHYRDKQLNKKNVVVIIMESFSNEYIGHFNNGKGHTPYFDSILNQSLVYDRCFANGKKSIEAVPALLASVPSLMNTPFIQSPFSTNSFFSIADALNPLGYKTSFYHGGKNGTMGFDSFIKSAGFHSYYGINQYPSAERDYDGTWGIYDEPYLQYFCDELSRKQEPFFSTVFTLSAHHPYSIPPEHTNRFSKDASPLLRSVEYSDYALHQFFQKASQQDWYTNTLFVLTSDHTAQLQTPEYNNTVGRYRIPLAFYAPGDTVLPVRTEHLTTQQADIMPSILHYLGYDKEFYALGNSVFDSTAAPYAINYYSGSYNLIQNEYVLRSNLEGSADVFNFVSDPELKNNLADSEPVLTEKMRKKLRAYVQIYNYSMVNNSLKKKSYEQ